MPKKTWFKIGGIISFGLITIVLFISLFRILINDFKKYPYAGIFITINLILLIFIIVFYRFEIHYLDELESLESREKSEMKKKFYKQLYFIYIFGLVLFIISYYILAIYESFFYRSEIFPFFLADITGMIIYVLLEIGLISASLGIPALIKKRKTRKNKIKNKIEIEREKILNNNLDYISQFLRNKESILWKGGPEDFELIGRGGMGWFLMPLLLWLADTLRSDGFGLPIFILIFILIFIPLIYYFEKYELREIKNTIYLLTSNNIILKSSDTHLNKFHKWGGELIKKHREFLFLNIDGLKGFKVRGNRFEFYSIYLSLSTNPIIFKDIRDKVELIKILTKMIPFELEIIKRPLMEKVFNFKKLIIDKNQ
ncbi:MAG: hypothetical protein ACFFAN_03950 [Promethearchaeota archaeon]